MSKVKVTLTVELDITNNEIGYRKLSDIDLVVEEWQYYMPKWPSPRWDTSDWLLINAQPVEEDSDRFTLATEAEKLSREL